MVDDSHGIGAFGATGRGTEEIAGGRADLLVATLGKALGVNGGYVVGDRLALDYLREKAPLYIYSNPITAAEAATALRALQILDSDRGRAKLAHLAEMTKRFESGLTGAGLRDHPGRAPGGAAHGPRHVAHCRTGRPPQAQWDSRHRSRLPGGATRR